MRGLKLHPLVIAMAGLAVAIPLLLILLRSLAHGMTYPAPRIPVGTPPEGFAEISLNPQQGVSCQGWFASGAGRDTRPVMIYFHGNGENLETLRMSGWLDTLRDAGLPVLAVEYPGYGRCSGRASEETLLDAASRAVRWVAANQRGRGWIAAGWSLGAAVAIQAAAQNPDQVRGLIVLSGWSSLPEMASTHFPGWLMRLLLSERYDSVSAARSVRCPVLVIHGLDDPIIPASLGKKLASSFNDVRYIDLPATGHNDLPSNERVREELAAFVNRLNEPPRQ